MQPPPLRRRAQLEQGKKNSPAATSIPHQTRPSPPWLQGPHAELGRGIGTQEGTAATMLSAGPCSLPQQEDASSQLSPRELKSKPAWEASET